MSETGFEGTSGLGAGAAYAPAPVVAASPFAAMPADMVSMPPSDPASPPGPTTSSAREAAVENARHGGYDELPAGSATRRPSGHALPDPPGGEGCLTPEGRQAAWARLLGRESYTRRDVEDYLARRRGAAARDGTRRMAEEQERQDNTLSVWRDGVERTGAVERQRRKLAELAWGNELRDPATAISYGVAGAFTDDENTRRSLGRLGGAGARVVGSSMAPRVRGTEPRPVHEPTGPSPVPAEQHMKGRPVEPTPKTMEHALDKVAWAHAVASKYRINLRGVKIVYDPHLPQVGVTRKTDGGNVIVIGPKAVTDEATLANTIAHELSHARDYRRGESHKPHGNDQSLDDGTSYGSGNALEEYIRGNR